MSHGKGPRGGVLMPLLVLLGVVWFLTDYQGFEMFVIHMTDRLADLVRAMGDHLEGLSAR